MGKHQNNWGETFVQESICTYIHRFLGTDPPKYQSMFYCPAYHWRGLYLHRYIYIYSCTVVSIYIVEDFAVLKNSVIIGYHHPEPFAGTSFGKPRGESNRRCSGEQAGVLIGWRVIDLDMVGEQRVYNCSKQICQICLLGLGTTQGSP